MSQANSSEYNHPEWRVQNSLTCPSDRVECSEYKPTQGSRPLSEEEVINAMKENNNKTFTHQFLAVEKKYADPVDPIQRIGLFSFVPAKGATPNEKGVYGFAKIRGNYATEQEADERAEFLIRNIDSYHQIYHTYVGRPFPLTTSSDYSGEKKEINLREEAAESISANIKTKRQNEKKEIQEIHEREKQLLQETKKEEDDDPMDHYITLRVKKAQLTWTYLETQRKMTEVKDIIIKTRNQLNDMENTSAEYKDKYFKKYCEARAKSGLDNASHQENFMKFMVEDGDSQLGF